MTPKTFYCPRCKTELEGGQILKVERIPDLQWHSALSHRYRRGCCPHCDLPLAFGGLRISMVLWLSALVLYVVGALFLEGLPALAAAVVALVVSLIPIRLIRAVGRTQHTQPLDQTREDEDAGR